MVFADSEDIESNLIGVLDLLDQVAQPIRGFDRPGWCHLGAAAAKLSTLICITLQPHTRSGQTVPESTTSARLRRESVRFHRATGLRRTQLPGLRVRSRRTRSRAFEALKVLVGCACRSSSRHQNTPLANRQSLRRSALRQDRARGWRAPTGLKTMATSRPR